MICCPKCRSENISMGMIDGRDYRGVFLSCKNCGSLFGRGGRPMQELVEEARQKRKGDTDGLV